MFNFSFDDIEAMTDDKSAVEDSTIESELSLYERIYLYKKQEIDHDMVKDIAPLNENISLDAFKNVVFIGFKRYYYEDLSKKNYSLESTTPFRFEINNCVIEDNSWGDMICKVVYHLLTIYPEKRADIYNFRCPWTKAEMFFLEPKTNSKCVFEDLHVNCNHTALHSCWFLQEVLDYFDIEKESVKFLIHRPSVAEPNEVKQYIYWRFVRGFTYYLVSRRKKDIERAEKIVRIINKYLNPILQSMSKSYNNLFLFDDNAVFYNYAKKIKEKVDSNPRYQEKEKKLLNKNLSYLVDYYKL